LSHTLVECGPGHPEGRNAPFRPMQSLPAEEFYSTLETLKGAAPSRMPPPV